MQLHLCCSSVVVNNNQESSCLMCPAVTDEADTCSEGTAADETPVLRQSLGLGADSGFSPLTLLLSVTDPVLFVESRNFVDVASPR